MKTILMVGGGSGGHIAPAVAVAEKILKKSDKSKIYFYCDKPNLKIAQKLFKHLPIQIEPIISGKLRRYPHLKWWAHLQPSILIPNLIDFLKVILAFVQTFMKVSRLKPDVIFAKGGYPCLPFGLISHLKKIPLIIHDSDAVAGLTNRILAKNARIIATGMPTKYYNYPKNKMIFAGIPVKANLRPISAYHQAKIKQKLNLSSQKMIFLTGGGLGSNFINDLAIKIAYKFKNRQIVLATGERDYARIKSKKTPNNLKYKAFVTNFEEYILASDLVITRAGATTIASLVASNKSAILIPGQKLAGGHQSKNALAVANQENFTIIDESTFKEEEIFNAIKKSLGSRQKLKNDKKIKSAADILAELILAK